MISFVSVNQLSTCTSIIAVYIHLGNEIPKHLLLNLTRHMDLFPSQHVVLVSSNDWQHELPVGIDNFVLSNSQLESSIFDEMSNFLNFEFRKGFWKFTLQRLFVLEILHREYPHTELLHIESDVILMPNFPWNNFKNISKLAWLPVNSEYDIAALLYSPNLEYTGELVQFLSKHIADYPNTNDMKALRSFVIENPEKHRYLPSFTKETLRKNLSETEPKRVEIESFEGIFDPLAFGMWCFGQDPKNSLGLSRRYVLDESHLLDPSQVHLSLIGEELVDSTGKQVYNLHIHSKSLGLFGKDWKHKLHDGLLEARNQENAKHFLPSVFAGLVRSNGFLATFWEIMGNMPILKWATKYPNGKRIKNQLKSLLRI
jgi:hypothetical protein